MVQYRYSRWDGTQSVDFPTSDDLVEHIAEKVLEGDDLRSVLRRMLQRGAEFPGGRRMMGLQELMERPLGDLDVVAVMIDGIEFQGSTVVAALGFAADGSKQVLGIWQGASENSQVCKDLLANLVERGLPTDSSLLFVLDGSKALRKAVKATFGKRALIQRCLAHKARNVLSYLPPKYHAGARQRLWAAWGLHRTLARATGRTVFCILVRRSEQARPAQAQRELARDDDPRQAT